MSKANTLYLGLDVHKDTTDVAVAYDALDDAVAFHGTIPTNIRSVNKLIRKYREKASRLCVVYEAGPCGFWLYRHLTKQGIDCWVVAPALIPKAPGDVSTTPWIDRTCYADFRSTIWRLNASDSSGGSK